ncbi:MAG: hypothetical protein QXV17_04965 [Candidatus Micrarchaeaceae archaeon]
MIVGQNVTYNGKPATVVSVYTTKPLNIKELDVKLPDDPKQYPVYVLRINDGSNKLSVISSDTANNL